MSQSTDLLKKPVVIMKMIELALCVMCLGICSTSLFSMGVIEVHLINGTFVGFFMVGVILLLGYLVGTPLKKEVAMFVCGAAAIMFLTSGALLLAAHVTAKHDRDLPIAMGSVAIINCVVYAADVVVTYKTAE